MINYSKHLLSNGLDLIVHEDKNTPMVCLNLLYKVGSRNESPEKTGFAHLFEHLMFGGSANIPNFDEPLQAVGGDNNAFTSTDITNYYITIPAENVETAFWLESDRMVGLSFNPEVLEVQRKVVIEEFRQRYLNQPYGDVWLKLRPVAYNTHPYQWPTIGKDISHIEQATMTDVKSFFEQHYHPGNAILVVAGNITEEKALSLTEKWFGGIPVGNASRQAIPKEPQQTSPRFLEKRNGVPAEMLYKVYHVPARTEKDYYSADLLSDLLGRGKSSFLYERLVKKNPLFSSIAAHVTGSIDPGLLVINGKLLPNVSLEEADGQIKNLIAEFQSGLTDKKLEKVKNQSKSTIVFSEVDLLNRAMGLAFATFMGETNLVNTELEKIESVFKNDILTSAEKHLSEDNCTTFYYRKK